MALIRSEVTEVIRSRCLCEFQEYLIDQSVLDCDEQTSAAVFRAITFSSTAYLDVNGLVRFVEDWVKQGPNITTNGSMLVLDTDFPITDSSCNDVECVQPSPSSSPTASPSEPDMLVVIISAAVIAAVLVALVVVIVVIIACCLKHKQQTLSSPKGLVLVSLWLYAYLQ